MLRLLVLVVPVVFVIEAMVVVGLLAFVLTLELEEVVATVDAVVEFVVEFAKMAALTFDTVVLILVVSVVFVTDSGSGSRSTLLELLVAVVFVTDSVSCSGALLELVVDVLFVDVVDVVK